MHHLARTLTLGSTLFAFVVGCTAATGDESAVEPDPFRPLVADPSHENPGILRATAADAGVDATPPPPPPADTAPPDSVKKVLAIDWQHQSTGYWCGPASTRIALSTRMTSPPSQSTLASYLGTTVDGTDHIGLVAGALNHYLGTTRYVSKSIYDPPTSAQREGLKNDILTLIGEGFPMVINVISGWRPPGYPSGTIYHYVAVVGYDESGELALVADPAGEGSGGWSTVPRTYWVSLTNLAIWIGGKGYTGT